MSPLLRHVFAAAAFGLALPAQALILDAAPNKFYTTAEVQLFFSNPTASLTGGDRQVVVVEDPGVAGGAAASASLLPFSGAPKDIASGGVAISFLGGAGLATDRLSISFSGMASALAAEAGPGAPASAMVSLRAFMTFYLDPAYTGLAPGTVIGLLSSDALRPAGPYENFGMQLWDTSGGLSESFPGGFSGSSLPLIVGHAYEINASYVMDVPYGVDPAISLTMTVTAAVPEPATLLLWLSGLLGLAAIRMTGRQRSC